MATTTIDEVPTSNSSRLSVNVGRGLTGLAILFLAADAAGKLIAPEIMLAHTPARLRMPADPNFYRLLGTILTGCTVLYAVPRTAVIGALLLTAYLGGAVATHLIAGSPLFSEGLFGAYVGLAVWGGLYLREQRLRTLLPLRG
jgi:hypothetical protein